MLETIRTYLAENLPYITLFDTNINVLSQVAGLIGFILIGVAYQKKKLSFLILSCISYIAFVLEGFFLLGESNTLSNVIGNSTSVLRNLAMIFCLVKHNRDLPAWASIPFVALYWGGAIPTLSEWYSFLPPIATTLYSLAAIQKNYYVLKFGALFLEVIFLIYHPITGAYMGAIRQAVLVACILISITRMYRAEKAKKQAGETTPAADQPTKANPPREASQSQ